MTSDPLCHVPAIQRNDLAGPGLVRMIFRACSLPYRNSYLRRHDDLRFQIAASGKCRPHTVMLRAINDAPAALLHYDYVLTLSDEIQYI